MAGKLCFKAHSAFWICSVLAACFFVSCKKQDEPNNNKKHLSTMTDNEIRLLVDRICEVEWIRPKNPRLQEDEVVSSIVTLGERAAPYLVEKITDESPSRCPMWYKVGDVAHKLLCAIYNRWWPSQEFADKYELAGSGSSFEYNADLPYLMYYNRLLRTDDAEQNQENRLKLQEAWRAVVKEK
jgi:hypothetical protein